MATELIAEPTSPSRWGALRHRDFRLFWTARAVSVAGDRISQLALPTVAILVLGASAAQVGVLNALGALAWPLLAVFAGVWVDRLRRRRILIATDLGRALLMGSIPVAFALGHLTLLHLYLVAVLVGAMTVFFDLASTAHMPTIVPRQDWADANSKLEVVQQAVYTAGPGVAGLLINVMSAPIALTLDAVSFLLSGGLVARTAPETAAAPSGPRRHLAAEAKEGLTFLVRHPALVRITIAAALSNVGVLAALSVQLLFLYRVMHLSPLVVGVCFGLGSLASLVGAVYNRRIMNRLGIHRTLIISTFLEGLAWLLTPAGLFAPVVPLVIAGLSLSGFFNTTWNVSVTTFRQQQIAPELMGRVSAASRTLGYGALPVGSFLGGVLGQILASRLGERNGLALTMAIAACVAAGSAFALLGTRAFDSERS
jgi:MFS family permease